VHVLRVVSPDVLAFPVVVTCLTIVVIGSRLRPVGALLGAVVIVSLPEWFRELRDVYLLAYGVILLLVIVLAPSGLLEALERKPSPSGRGQGEGRAAETALTPSLSRREREKTVVLEAAGLSKRFGGVLAVDDVSLEVRAGEALALIGPNGSGKTTFVNLVSGLYRPDAGRVRLLGEDVTGRAAHLLARAGIARTFQTVALVPDMTALDNVAVARHAARIGLAAALRQPPHDPALAAARAEAAVLLERMGAGDAALRPAGALPYGISRRVEIARALATEPRLLLLDEPAAGLNETEQADLARRLRALLADGLALLVIEHNMGFLAPLVDRMACLDAGRLIAAGRPAEVRADPRVVEAYLGTA
jgi:branched-chain amino acid transport system permease protein